MYMKNIFIITLELLMFFILFLLPVKGECTVRYGSCFYNETCIFSLYQPNDTHIGECGYFNYSLCCGEVLTSKFRNTCKDYETTLISVYKNNDTHVATSDYYSVKVCIAPEAVINIVNGSCSQEEIPMFSLYKLNDSHVAEPGYFSYTVCMLPRSEIYVKIIPEETLIKRGNTSYYTWGINSVVYSISTIGSSITESFPYLLLKTPYTNKIFLIFTRPDEEIFLKRIELLRTGEFFNLPKLTFGYDVGNLYKVLLILEYMNLQIEKRKILYPGIYTLKIFNNPKYEESVITISVE